MQKRDPFVVTVLVIWLVGCVKSEPTLALSTETSIPRATATLASPAVVLPTIALFNDGTGIFADSGQQLSTTRFGGVGLEDLDRDGDLDAFITNFQRPDEVWLNDGLGYFRDSGLSLGGSNPSNGCALGDLDGDGDVDVFVASFGDASNVIWLNGE